MKTASMLLFGGLILMTSGNASATGISILVPSNPVWTDTKISLSDGVAHNVQVSVTATGSWTAAYYGYPYSGPDGLGGSGGYDEWVPSASKGSLIGYIGNDPYSATSGWFNIGSANTFTAASGNLWLGFNDDKVSGGAWDNLGQVNAVINIPFADIVRDSVTRQVVTESSRLWEVGTFTPKFGLTLSEAKVLGGFDHFNWYQVIRQDTHLNRCISDNATCDDIDRNASGTILSLPYEDPPLGGYFNGPDDNLHGYYKASEFSNPGRGAIPAVTTPTSFSLIDSPCIDTVGDHYLFSTYLGGVDTFGNLIVFAGGNTSFRWEYTQLSATDCTGSLSNLKTILSDIIVPNEGLFGQLEFINADNIGAEELAFLAREGVGIQFIDGSSQSVPEPGTPPLLGAALTALMVFRRHKRGKSGNRGQ